MTKTIPKKNNYKTKWFFEKASLIVDERARENNEENKIYLSQQTMGHF